MAVEAAPTGEDALEHLEAHAFDVVVLDVMLPNMNGLEVCRRLRATGSTAAIVFLTARWDLEVRERSVVAGASDFFPKPFSLDELAARLLELGARRND
jgi:two-component system OmpR family response regulator